MTSTNDNARDIKVSYKENKKNLEEKVAHTAVVEYADGIFSKYMCEFNSLKKYFDINTSDFFGRFLKALIPFNSYFYSSIEINPDLWGPIWINTFLVFLIASCGTLVKYLTNTKADDSFYQEFIPISAGVVYGVGLVLPLILYILMKCFGSKSSLITIVCVYGYSMGIYIPVIIACSIPIGIVQWIILGYAVFSSTSIMLVSYWKEMDKYFKWQKLIILGILLIFQAGFFCSLKFYFFKFFNSNITNNKL